MDNIIYEIKGYEKEEVSCKTQSVLDSGYKIEILREEEIFPLIRNIKKKYKIKDITILYDQKFEVKKLKAQC